MTKRLTLVLAVLAGGLSLPAAIMGRAFSIYEIQYTDEPDGRSPLEAQVIDCAGGIVTHKYEGYRPKLTIQDPNFPLGWGAIQVKDWVSGAPLFNKAALGDWVRLSNVYVDEFRGNTILQCWYDNDPNLTVVSSGNPLPEPLIVSLDEIASPESDSQGDWYVQDHNAEMYEHMRLRVEKVTVVGLGYGKAADNYILQDRNDPNLTCWAADYMNDEAMGDYHPFVRMGQSFCSVEGVLEQYTRLRNGWDYYQLVTTGTRDFVISQQADIDGDCDVDFCDFSLFARNWLAQEFCAEPDWCQGSDLNHTGFVDANDLMEFSENWLEGKH